jgi:hypothetical protein
MFWTGANIFGLQAGCDGSSDATGKECIFREIMDGKAT